MSFNSPSPDLDGIARNLSYLDLAHVTPAECAAYEHELSAIASLNEALETVTLAIRTPGSSPLWHRLYPMLSDAAALLTSQIAPLLDLNAERSFPITDRPLALTAHASTH